MKTPYQKIKELIDSADAIVIGAGAGLSTAAGFSYSGLAFMKNFKYMHDKYGYTDMYSAGFHMFDSLEEYWGYWSKFVYLNRFTDSGLPLYKNLFSLIKNKNYFVITTNVDHQFQKTGFDKSRLFYTQGDYGLFQCSNHCHDLTYDNEEIIRKMVEQQINHKIPTELIPTCPVCGKPMSMNLRCDDYFAEDKGWHKAKERYTEFLYENRNKKVLYLELGVGFNTPVIIKYPFWRFVKENKNSTYVSINLNNDYVPEEIKNQSIITNDDIASALSKIEAE
ncbi:MAG: Sir2 silent information regulator family NAD-dependent deacetylase [Bacilli bacterium]